MVKVTRNSSVDLSQSVVVAEFATRVEAAKYIAEHTVDGTNVSDEIECDYLCIADAAIEINGVAVVVPAGAVAYKYADPTEDARWIYDAGEARQIASEDPSLIVLC